MMMIDATPVLCLKQHVFCSNMCFQYYLSVNDLSIFLEATRVSVLSDKFSIDAFPSFGQRQVQTTNTVKFHYPEKAIILQKIGCLLQEFKNKYNYLNGMTPST
jgi:hypothetical protein